MTVYRFKVKVKGLEPILMENPFSMEMEEKWKKDHGSRVLPPEEVRVEWLAYKTKEGFLYAPNDWAEAVMREAAKLVKLRGTHGKTAKDFITRSTRVRPDKIILMRNGKPIKEYSVDKRLVRLKGGVAILRSRPCVDLPWEAEFDVIYNQMIGGMDLETVKDVIRKSGYMCWGGFRPKFGMYEVVSLEVEEA